jgi:hypothetical protein
MQFKKIGGRVQVLAYRGYDKEKRRSVVQLLGTMNAYTFEPSVGLLEKLTDDEKTELQSYKEKIRQQEQKQYDSHSVLHIDSRIDIVSKLLETPENYSLNQQWGDGVWLALDKLQKALKKAGHQKPKKAPKPKPQDDKQAGLNL